MPFTAQQHTTPESFIWRAHVGLGPLTLFRVLDSFVPGSGVMDVCLFGRARIVHSEDENTARSSAGRAALDAAAYAPPILLSHPGLRCAARSDELIVCTWDVPHERPEVHIRIDHQGAVRSVSALRWGKMGTKDYQYIPCGGDVFAERRFGDYLLPSSLSVGWWWGTPRFKPFFRAELDDVVPALRTEALL